MCGRQTRKDTIAGESEPVNKWNIVLCKYHNRGYIDSVEEHQKTERRASTALPWNWFRGLGQNNRKTERERELLSSAAYAGQRERGWLVTRLAAQHRPLVRTNPPPFACCVCDSLYRSFSNFLGGSRLLIHPLPTRSSPSQPARRDEARGEVKARNIGATHKHERCYAERSTRQKRQRATSESIKPGLKHAHS